MSSGSQTNMLRWRQKATPTQAQIEAAHQIRVWLGRNATAETNPEKKAAFIEAHNVALKIEEAALTAAAEVGDINPRTGPDAAHPSPLMSDEAARMLAEAIKQLAQAISSTARGGYAGSGLAGPPGDPADSNY